MRYLAPARPRRVVLEPAREPLQQQRGSTGRLDLIVDRARRRGGLDAVRQPLELAVEHQSAAELEDERVLPDQPRSPRTRSTAGGPSRSPPRRPRGEHACSARTPSSENQPSAPRSSEPPGPSRVPSRSTYMHAHQRAANLASATAILARCPPRLRPSPGRQLLDDRRADERLVYNDFMGTLRAPLFVRSRRPAPAASTTRSERPGSTQLYAHQRDARSTSAYAGPTIVTTGTASGKSLCFQLPTLEVLVRRPERRGRCTCTRPRRWPRTRRARCTRSG